MNDKDKERDKRIEEILSKIKDAVLNPNNWRN